ncbi:MULTISPECIES: TPM domain-containing protein [Flavobacterium]|uniref:TPM domain-containing protein n=1 Tax=Flavobacterium columnare TaxID=996 RepID=A0AA94F2I7_9FLAO|nr:MULTISPECIES: TPM domain-containing protein [Flavobacterium]MCH4828416.1 TPM domain-containing protein [Flavobacterium columnare]MCH4832244.1 TPM domain-containing protein [Flavobacterium columnare]QYS90250.1 TPM domain-containing protein [Flavobacterium covae]
MSIVEDFLSKTDEEEVVEAIRSAESLTSGEIRVHIEKNTSLVALERAKEVFYFLKMDQTQLRNGVLLYVAVETKTFAIYGDKGINEVIPVNFWESTRDVILDQFKQGNFKQGLIEGILKAGILLQEHFPCTETDKNELPDTLSKG